jgi:SAM-dependent methyltransferase
MNWKRPSWIEHHQDRYARGLDLVVAERNRWLDVGAGTKIYDSDARFPQDVVARRASPFIGCDLVVDHLRRNPYITNAVGASIAALPFANDSFDVVSANMVLEHLDAPDVAFQEIARVLRPGGRFIGVTPNARNPIILGAFLLLSSRMRSWLAHVIENRDEEHIFPTHYRANSERALRDLARKSGLTVETVDVFNTVPLTLDLHPVVRSLELVLIRLLTLPGLKGFASNLFVVLRKPSVANS